jgi:heat shock protein HslJ
MGYMNKTIALVVFLIALILGGLYVIFGNTDADDATSGPLNTTYLINEEPFALINGSVEKEAVPGSATKNKVSVFGEPALGDIDGDGDDDAVVILVNDSGGSGRFYYAVIAANINGEYKGTDAILLGDRISPQSFYVQDRRAVVNYVVRAPSEDFSVQPSIGKSLHLQFEAETLRLIQVEVNFEGEADPNTMMLDMKVWKWIKTTYNNDTERTPKEVDAFTLTFKDDGTFSATTDCNSLSGDYTTQANRIVFGENIAMTKKFCENSEEQEFISLFSETEFFLFTSKGELVLELKVDSGSALFR